VPFSDKKYGRWSTPLLILSGLWIFTFLAGASPSVLRSAVMFTCIVAGETMNRKSSLLNSLSASAFLLLCIQPYWLWDAGFILSYLALLSIALFNQPLYELTVLKNKMLDGIWKLNAVTLAAQVLTMPVIIYYYGQFPALFMLTNSIAIPLSSIILLGEILLCALSFWAPLAALTGNILESLIRLMNATIVYIDRMHFSTIKNIDISFAQMLFLYSFITFVSCWLILHKKQGLPASLLAAICFLTAGHLKIWQ
jgi:competence protein ComEC